MRCAIPVTKAGFDFRVRVAAVIVRTTKLRARLLKWLIYTGFNM